MNELKREKALCFVEHIEKHLKELDEQDLAESRGYTLKYPRVVLCKICEKTIDEIFEERRRMKKC